MSNIDKRALREAAEKATPGVWVYLPKNTSIEYDYGSDDSQGSVTYMDSGDFTQKQTDLNGAFIAAANPANVLALLDELEAKDAKIANLTAELDALREGARASLEAEAVGYFGRFDADDEDLIDQCSPNISGAFPLYAAPPAPVVPDKITSANAPEVFEIATEAERLGLRGAYASYAVGWNACRAAMLQGAGENSPVVQDGLPAVCAEAYQVVGVMAEALGVFDDASIQKVMDNLAQQKLVHCDVLPFSLPAAPQQEVKS
ncbi:ead/Ea22-like family protein [Enterobacter sp. 50588862]|uniref:ead/Ea22-like family protein n=1 Tax=Enterobacter sp. 50588862 TaxID=1736698 RepID=UPI00073B0F31|nr:ead/Ea22-like family protein [Enterobacter sp. 50588862]KSX62282.1 hypothetical protein APT89_13010 [Enterobacter sp. 50588862]KSX62332.1 hypothetical protein APT89_13275 [Enterobacter sp. 50588862]